MDGTFLDGEGGWYGTPQDLLVSARKEFAVASRSWYSVLKKLFADVRDGSDFIAENAGSYVEFHGEDMYEATMSQFLLEYF